MDWKAIFLTVLIGGLVSFLFYWVKDKFEDLENRIKYLGSEQEELENRIDELEKHKNSTKQSG